MSYEPQIRQLRRMIYLLVVLGLAGVGCMIYGITTLNGLPGYIWLAIAVPLLIWSKRKSFRLMEEVTERARHN